MSRLIKFRAWDTETKEMSYDFLSKNWLRVCIESPYVELMQYTGLKDKNGKEIYEGDILKCVSVPRKHDQKTHTIIAPVVWGTYDDGEYLFAAECWMCDGIPVSDMKSHTWGHSKYEVEVIGNVWENAELLHPKDATEPNESAQAKPEADKEV